MEKKPADEAELAEMIADDDGMPDYMGRLLIENFDDETGQFGDGPNEHSGF